MQDSNDVIKISHIVYDDIYGGDFFFIKMMIMNGAIASRFYGQAIWEP